MYVLYIHVNEHAKEAPVFCLFIVLFYFEIVLISWK